VIAQEQQFVSEEKVEEQKIEGILLFFG